MRCSPINKKQLVRRNPLLTGSLIFNVKGVARGELELASVEVSYVIVKKTIMVYVL